MAAAEPAGPDFNGICHDLGDLKRDIIEMICRLLPLEKAAAQQQDIRVGRRDLWVNGSRYYSGQAPLALVFS